MRPNGPSRTIVGTRSIWEPPVVTKLAIGTETKSALKNGQRSGLETSDSGRSGVDHPLPPAAPAMKLGFSFEMAFPLSARLE